MKIVCTAASLSTLLSAFIVITAPVHAAPGQLPLQLSDELLSGHTAPHGLPVNLMSFSVARPTMESAVGRVTCSAGESRKVCDVRAAAAQRAWEVLQENKDHYAPPMVSPGVQPSQVPPMGLLVPVGFIPVRAIACDPALSTEECARLEKRIPSNPPGPLSPNAPLANRDPSPAITPVPVMPPSVIPPPPTGDHDLVQPPPKTDSKMPVIKPKAASPVNPQPQ